MDALLVQQTLTIRSINRALDNFRKLGKDNVTFAKTKSRLSTLQDHWTQCQQQHAQLILNADDETRATIAYFVDDQFTAAEDTFTATSDYMMEWWVKLEPKTTSPASTSSSASSQERNVGSFSTLPSIDLPTFSGQLREWESFRDRFKSLVMNDRNLSNDRKMHYLCSCLKGKASDEIKTLPITDANFAIAWKKLETRYENKRRLINAHLSAFFNLPKIRSDSVSELMSLRDETNIFRQTLTNLGRPVDSWDDVLVYAVAERLDAKTRMAWEMKLGDTIEYPTYDALDQFLNSRVRALEAMIPINESHEHSSDGSKSRYSSPRSVQSHTGTQAPSEQCAICRGNHFMVSCAIFNQKSPSQRFTLVKQLKRCINCLSARHGTKQCTSRYCCRVCQKKHHSMLHMNEVDKKPESSQVDGPSGSSENRDLACHCSSNTINVRPKVLLATAWVQVGSSSGRCQNVRALLDQGSEATFLSSSLARTLQVTRKRVDVSVSGIAGIRAGTARYSTNISVTPCSSSGPSYSTDALIMDSLTNYVPSVTNEMSNWTHIKNLRLADPDISSNIPFQLIIGADLYGSILLSGVKKGHSGDPIAQETIFGWILSGPTSVTSPIVHAHFTHESPTLDQAFRQFWEIEELPRVLCPTPDEQQCEEHFRTSHSRTADGRYIVRLPFKRGPPIPMGESYYKARVLLTKLERRLETKPSHLAEYHKFLSEYEQMGHMSRVNPTDVALFKPVYIPHQEVIRESSTTSHLRVVFNASCHSSNSSSLNDHLLIGPKLQSDLPSVMLRWRQNRYVYTADIAKMYRQILVDARDVDFQRILWRSSPDDQIEAYRLLTVTYGTACAPFIALRVLRQLSEDEGTSHPLAVPILNNNIYVDDVLFGADDVDSIRSKRDDLNHLLQKGGFRLRKWASNTPALLDDIAQDDHGLACPKSFKCDDSLKILGVVWNPASDAFQFRISKCDSIPNTKRGILSAIAKLFDPLGWVTPVIITAKIIMQKLWLQSCDWDDRVPENTLQIWTQYYVQLPRLNCLILPRWTGQSSDVVSSEIHAFSDASNLAYAAVVYLRLILPSGQIITSLIASKSKVAPIKTMSIPRLELQAAVLLAKLVTFVQEAMHFPSITCHCWTDSTIVLAWLAKHPSCWKTFIANRVAFIQSHLPSAQWHHVSTEDNPADCSSRGITSDELIGHALWWTGPSWLTHERETWPDTSSPDIEGAMVERKAELFSLIASQNSHLDLGSKISSWVKMLKITAYVLRFTALCRRYDAVRSCNTNSPASLTSGEIQDAKRFCIGQIQRELFPNEFAELSQGRPVSKNSAIVSLNPFLDEHKIIRVGGRLKHSNLPNQIKHPILLSSHRIVTRIIRHAHLRAYHAGPQLTLCTLREEYWILRARQTVRTVLHKCVTCVRERAAVPTQLMGNLPQVRVTPGERAFLNTGIDYAGPYNIRSSPGRGHKSHKAYIAVFVCMTTRALHFELVNSYTSDAFLAAFTRFCARRGFPSAMYSDNGTTFRGADRELARSFKSAMSDPNLQNHIALDQIDWHFIPPASPHFGGLWESGVRSLKHHLKRVVKDHTLTYEEFTTLLNQVEACVNSRPIAPLSDCLDDYNYLTPGHFLIGATLTTPPGPTTLDLNDNRLSRWQLVRKMYESLWKWWANDYLHSLQQRSKWRFEKDNVKPGCVVLVRNPLAPPCKWELGRILECHQGDDKLTRVVTVKTASSQYRRPISKICLLPITAYEKESSCEATANGNQH